VRDALEAHKFGRPVTSFYTVEMERAEVPHTVVLGP